MLSSSRFLEEAPSPLPALAPTRPEMAPPGKDGSRAGSWGGAAGCCDPPPAPLQPAAAWLGAEMGDKGPSCDLGDGSGTSWGTAKVEAPLTQPRGLSHPTGHCPLGHVDPPTPSHHLPAAPPRPAHLGSASPAPCYGTVEVLQWGTSAPLEGVTGGRGGKRVVKGHSRAPPAPCPCPRGGISSPQPRHPRQHLHPEGC